MKVAILTLSFILLLPLQSLCSSAALSLGMTRDDVHRALGQPISLWVGLAARRFPLAQEETVVSIYGQLCDVYGRKTQSNEYELRVWYSADTTSSRLHPVLRVHRVDFILDRNAAVEETLQDLAEFRTICIEGCHLIASVLEGVGRRFVSQFLLYGDHVSASDADIASKAATNFSGTPSTTGRWSPGARFTLTGDAQPGLRALIEEVTLTALAPDSERSYSKILDLGEWKPKP